MRRPSGYEASRASSVSRFNQCFRRNTYFLLNDFIIIQLVVTRGVGLLISDVAINLGGHSGVLQMHGDEPIRKRIAHGCDPLSPRRRAQQDGADRGRDRSRRQPASPPVLRGNDRCRENRS